MRRLRVRVLEGAPAPVVERVPELDDKPAGEVVVVAPAAWAEVGLPIAFSTCGAAVPRTARAIGGWRFPRS
jgi:hypothetical protein